MCLSPAAFNINLVIRLSSSAAARNCEGPAPSYRLFSKLNCKSLYYAIRPGSHQLLRPYRHGLLHHLLHLHRALPPRPPPHPNQTLFLFSHRKLPPPHVSTSPRPRHSSNYRAHSARAEHSPASPVQCSPSCCGLLECRPPPPLHHSASCFNPRPQPCRLQLGVAFNGVCTIGKIGGEPPTGDIAAFQILEYCTSHLLK